MIVWPVQPGGLITKYFMACEYYELLTLAIEMLNMAYDRTALSGRSVKQGRTGVLSGRNYVVRQRFDS
jgi:hypothetical protein